MLDGECSITIGSVRLSGWTSVQVHRSCEAIPNHFTISAAFAESVPSVVEGSPCEVFLGDDQVITGYADTISVQAGAASHTVTIIGRGKTQDLVDCTCEPKNDDPLLMGDAADIAGNLCKPYGIDVSVRADILPDGKDDPDKPKLPIFTTTFTDTPASVMTEIARFFGVLCFESPQGELVFERAGTHTAASELSEGQNVLGWKYDRTTAERFSEIRVYTSAGASALANDFDHLTLVASRNDPNVKRHRRHAQISASPVIGFGDKEAAWELARRAGRSRIVSVTVAGWRDAEEGALWEPNTLAQVTLPSVGLNAAWLIADVTYRRDGGGTTTDLTLMAPEAFSVQPILLAPAPPDVLDALANKGAAETALSGAS